MGIRKITFDNGDIVLAKDQAILYDLLLKQQTKTLFSNGETIYQNSTGFLIQNETEKLKYTHETAITDVEFTFNTQLYLSICGRIIKLEKDSKYLFDWNYIENNETYYIVVRVNLSKEAKIIKGELKEFGNPIEVKLINTKEKLIHDNLNQKPNNGIYEFPLISFIKQYNANNSWKIKTKDESTYLLPILMKSTRNPSKLLTITQKIQEEKENIENYLTNLKYRKTQELNELENLMTKLIKIPKNERPQIPENNNWKLIEDKFNDFWELEPNNKWYLLLLRNYLSNNWNIMKVQLTMNPRHIKFEPSLLLEAVYCWNKNNEPITPIINKNTGKITDWK